MNLRKNSLTTGILIKTAVLTAEIYALIRVWHWKPGFTFFTQLSTIFMSVMMAWSLIYELKKIRSKRMLHDGRNADRQAEFTKSAAENHNPKGSGMMYIIKYMATVSVTVTFLVYLLILGPFTKGGLSAAYSEDHYASLCFHLIVPLLSIADYLVSDARHPLPKRSSLYAVFPPLAYMVFIVILGKLGMDWWGMKAPYFFLNYASPTGWFGFDLSALSATCPGIGVFYIAVLFAVLCVLLGRLLIFFQKCIRGRRS